MSEHSVEIREFVTRDLIAYGLTPARAEELIAQAEQFGTALKERADRVGGLID